MEITSPEDGAELTESPITVNGTVSDANATVTVNDTAVDVASDGSFSAQVELAYGANNITVTATVEGVEPVTETIAVTRVLGLGISSPEDGAELTESTATVNGTVSDPEAAVTANGEEVEVAEDGSFSTIVELTEGGNLIEVVAIVGEQEVSESITVTYTPAE
jgi:bacillopeptidase F